MNRRRQKAKNKKLLIAGVHTASEAYPNTLYAIEKLRIDFCPCEINIPLLPETGGAIRLRKSRFSSAFKFLTSHIGVLFRTLKLHRWECTYVPYPSIFLLLAWSLFPKRFRPRKIVADAFISIYDTTVNDRQLLSLNGHFAKLLKSVECRAFRTADAIIVDTPQNADFYSDTFQLPRQLFIPIPLLTNENDYFRTPLPNDGRCNVLFVGTLIPLHGIGVILTAAKLLAHRKEITLTIIGDGQEADAVETSIIDGVPNLIWEREWMPPARLAKYIESSSICLGIFGESAKTDRVCPYKIYTYASAGRPVITANSSWLKQAAKDYGKPPFIGIPPGDPTILAEKIMSLVDNAEQRKQMADAANHFYTTHLSNQIAYSRLRTCLLENGAT